jgi:cell division protein FtsB
MTDAHSSEVELGWLGWMNRILMTLIVLALLAGIGLSYRPLIHQNQGYRERVQRKQEEVQRLEAELRRMEFEIRALKTDPRFLERKIRELGYARPDELVVTFKDTVR